MDSLCRGYSCGYLTLSFVFFSLSFSTSLPFCSSSSSSSFFLLYHLFSSSFFFYYYFFFLFLFFLLLFIFACPFFFFLGLFLRVSRSAGEGTAPPAPQPRYHDTLGFPVSRLSASAVAAVGHGRGACRWQRLALRPRLCARVASSLYRCALYRIGSFGSFGGADGNSL